MKTSFKYIKIIPFILLRVLLTLMLAYSYCFDKKAFNENKPEFTLKATLEHFKYFIN